MSDLFSVDRVRFLRIVRGQFIILFIMGSLGLIEGWLLAVSIGMGGLIPIMTNWLFAWRVFRHYSAQDKSALVGRFYKAEIEKLLIIALMFALIFINFDSVNVAGLFISFIVMQFSHVVMYQVLGD